MLLIKSFTVILLAVLVNITSIMACGPDNREPQNNKSKEKAIGTPVPKQESDKHMTGELKVLAEGSHAKAADTMLIIARDAETYNALRGLATDLPEMGADYFKSNIIVGAFLGSRRTGGYSVEIIGGPAGLIIKEQTPPKDAMVTMALTAPYKIVSVPMNGNVIALDLDKTWQANTRPYKVTPGTATFTGGIAGRTIKRNIDGDIHIMRHNNLVTFIFALRNYADNERVRVVKDVATGFIGPDGQMKIGRFNAGLLVEPNSGLRATGSLSNKDANLSLDFESLPPSVSDSFTCKGNIKATATGPAPQKRRPSFADEQPM